MAVACSPSLDQYSHPMSDSKNPLPECPETPNCERLTTSFSADSTAIYNALKEALSEMNAHTVEDLPDENRINAVFMIPVFGWKDDVNLVYESKADSTLVHIRSASREGYSDLGVNARRVKKLIKTTQKQLSN
jgi:uncharacterized protein (DUF1499 family)